MLWAGMGDSPGDDALLAPALAARVSELESGFPGSTGILLDRLETLYGLGSELGPARRVLDPPTSLETSCG
jgi:hypothetical protein